MSVISSPEQENKMLGTTTRDPPSCSSREQRCLAWSTALLGALIPLMIAVGTIVITFQQEKFNDLRRMQDLEIEENRRQRELKIEEQRYEQDQQQANNLYYQNVYKTYIEDISNVLFKINQTFIDNEMKMKYIRSKTLMALGELNSERKTQVFLFLYENDLLPCNPLSSNESNTNISVDLSRSHLVNISIKSTMASKYTFDRLSLVSADLTNASFIECDFINGVHFSGVTMDYTNFFGSQFTCKMDYPGNILRSLPNTHVDFNRVTLKEANFRSSYLCDVSFNGTNLAYANFSGVIFRGHLEFTSTNLAHVDFTNSIYHLPFSMNIMNANMTGVQWSSALYPLSYINFVNVIRWNGTWSINQTNLILNGNAQTNCSALLNRTNRLFSNWKKYADIEYPTLVLSQNSSNCYFNLTYLNNNIGMYQYININNFSVFIDSGEANFNLTTTVACTNGTLNVLWECYSAEGSQIYRTSQDLKSERLKWISYHFSHSIPVNTRQLVVFVRRSSGGTCYVDDIKWVIVRRE